MSEPQSKDKQAEAEAKARAAAQETEAKQRAAEQQHQAAGPYYQPSAPLTLGPVGSFARPQYKPSIAQMQELPPVAPLHGPGAVHAEPVVVPADFARFNPKVAVGLLRGVLEPAQAAAIEAACVAKDLPHARQLLREVFADIAARVNAAGDAGALDRLRQANHAADTMAAVKLYFATAQRLRELAKRQNITASLQPAMVRAPQNGANARTFGAGPDAPDSMLAISALSSPMALPSPSAPAVQAAVVAPSTAVAKTVAEAAAAVTERAGFVRMAMTSSSMQLGDPVARLNAAIEDVAAAVHRSGGQRSKAEQATLQAAWQAATLTADQLDLAHRSDLAQSIRQHISDVTHELQHIAAEPKAAANPAALAQKAQASLTALQGALALVAQLQASFPQLVVTGLAAEIAKTTGWITQLQGPAAAASAASLAMAIEEQATTVMEAAVEMTAVVARPVSTMTPAVLAAYVNVLAHASDRRSRVAPLLVRARVASKRQMVDRSREALEQAEDATNELRAMDEASAKVHAKTQRRLTQRRNDIEQRIKDGAPVRQGEIDTLENDTREESLMTRTQAIEQRGEGLAAALESLSSGVVGKLANQGRDYLPMIISNMHGIGKTMAAMRKHYAEMRDGNLQGDHRIHRRAAIVDFERRLETYFAGYNDKKGPLWLALQQAYDEIDSAKLRALFVNFGLMIGITLATAGTVALAVRGAGALVAGTIESGALTAAQAAWLVNAVGLSTSVLIGTATQKAMGDEGSVASIVIVNALTPWAMGKFAALLPELEAAAKVSSELGNRWITVERTVASALKLGGEVTGSMLVGAGVNYVVRRGMGEKVGDPSQVTAEEWLMQGAAMALGHVLMTRVGAMRSAIAAIEGDRVHAIRNSAAAAELRAQTEALQHAAELLSSADASPAKIQAAIKAYRHLQAAEATFLDALAASKAQAAPAQGAGRAPATTAAEPVPVNTAGGSTGGAEGRAPAPPSRETAPRNRAAASEFRTVIDDVLAHKDLNASYRVEVLSAKQFNKRFGAENGGAKVEPGKGEAVVYVRAGARPEVVAHEAEHVYVLHAGDERARFLSQSMASHNVKEWAQWSALRRRDWWANALEVELITAKHELGTAHSESRPGSIKSAAPEAILKRITEIEVQRETLLNLSKEDLSAMSAKASPMLPVLEAPPDLFAPRQVVQGEGRTPLAVDAPGVEVKALAVVNDTPQRRLPGVVDVRQEGQSWYEADVMSAPVDGIVVSIDPGKSRAGAPCKVIKLQANGSKRTTPRTVDADAQIIVQPGQSVKEGDMLAQESRRENRLLRVEYADASGKRVRRVVEEKMGEEWRAAGATSRIRGAIAEEANFRQTDEQYGSLLVGSEEAQAQKQAEEGGVGKAPIAARVPQASEAALRAEGVHAAVRVPVQNKSGNGLDDLIFEFGGTPERPVARGIIDEVKDYEGSVPFDSFTALKAERMTEHLKQVGEKAAIAADLPPEQRAESWMRDMSGPQLEAIAFAIKEGNMQVRLRLGPTTSVSAATVKALEAEAAKAGFQNEKIDTTHLSHQQITDATERMIDQRNADK